MDLNDFECMELSITKANEIKTEKLRVCVVIQLYNKQIITAVSTREDSSNWVSSAIQKLKALHIDKVKGIYLTINTLSNDGDFDLNLLLREFDSMTIYIGLPDPQLNNYKVSDPILVNDSIKRYPDFLQRKILNQNSNIYSISKQSIQFSPYYSEIRISKLVLDKFHSNNISITEEEIRANKTLEKLIVFVSQKHKLDINSSTDLVNKILSEAFNEKYGHYDYNQDARSISDSWVKDFKRILDICNISDLSLKKTINLGVGSGEEANFLFSNCKNITFVDIAPDGLKNISKTLPWAKVLQSSAENLNSVQNDSFDTYISLRTYNSSFFDTSLALSEAYRILKNGGIIIISIANGFRCITNSIIPGLILPNSEFVDIYRGLSFAKQLKVEYEKIGFSSVDIYPTNSEIYIIGKVFK